MTLASNTVLVRIDKTYPRYFKERYEATQRQYW